MLQVPDIRKLEFEVESGLGRIRLDDYLFAKLGRLSRMYLRELVKTERILVNGEFANVGIRLRSGDFIEVEADMSRGTAMRAEDIPLDIVYEDEAIIVVNKPAGMLVHPTHRDKNGTLLNALTFHLNRQNFPQNCKDAKKEFLPQGRRDAEKETLLCGCEDVEKETFPQRRTDAEKIMRPGLVHRLDRETSGLIVVAKTIESHRRLAREFMRKRVRKLYLALVDGVISESEGTISLPIGRFAEEKHWDVKEDGKVSETRFRVLRRGVDNTLLELEPITGRTNQLRIHCARMGHPIVGDVRRGGREFKRVCLHAYKLAFSHPLSHAGLSFELPPEANSFFNGGTPY